MGINTLEEPDASIFRVKVEQPPHYRITMRFDILTAVNIQVWVFWDVTL
jgi:hypothetical protein